MRDPNKTRAVLEKKQARLALYYEREAVMLSEDGIKTYALGSRSLSRYDTDLRAIQSAIKQLEDEIAELEANSPRRAVGVLPRDW